MAGFTLAQLKQFKKVMMRQGSMTSNSGPRDFVVKDIKGNVAYYIWGNMIARLSASGKTLMLSDAGWRTKLTKDRLNQLLKGYGSISQRNNKWWFFDKNSKLSRWTGKKTIRL
jgi:hypothetical protein